MKTIGIVGASGQVGNGLARCLSGREDLNCFGICRSNVSSAFLSVSGIQNRIVDIGSGSGLACEALDTFDLLVNCALDVGDPSSALAKNKDLLRGLLGWLNSRPGRTLIHLTTISSLGSGLRSAHGRALMRPDSVYGWQKKFADDLLGTAAIQERRRLCLWRIGGVYGRDQFATQELVALAMDERVALPFGGNLPSNLVSIELLGDCVAAYAIDEGLPAGLRSIHDIPNRSWGEVLDAVSSIVKTLKRPRLDARESERWRPEESPAFWNVLRAAGNDAGHASVRRISDWLRGRGAWLLTRLPLSLERAIRHRYDLKLAASGIRGAAPRWVVPPAFFNRALPGPLVTDAMPAVLRADWFQRNSAEVTGIFQLLSGVPTTARRGEVPRSS